MAVTPVELRHLKLKRTLTGGYRRRQVDEVLTEVADSFEDVWREREDLRDRVEHLEQELRRHRELEGLLRETLLSAEKSAIELKENARTEAELVIREAHSEARSITQEARSDRERLLTEARRVRALLSSALESVEETAPEAPEQSERPAQAA